MIEFRNNSTRIRTTAGVVLMPGVNLLTTEQVNAIKAHPGGKRKLAAKIYEAAEAEITSAADLARAIRDMNDLTRLGQLQNDPRKTVSEAAAARIAAIEAAAAPDGGGQGPAGDGDD